MIRFPDIHSHNIQSNGFQLINQDLKKFDASIPFYSVGLHPWFIDTYDDIDFENFEKYAQLTNCRAIGECGLDKNIEVSFERQRFMLKRQLDLALKFDKAVILHCVKSFQEITEICKSYLGKIPLVIHGFNKNQQLAKQLIDKGFYISLGKALLQKKELAGLPLEAIVLETDDAIFPIQNLYQTIADYRNESIEVVEKQIIENVSKILRIV